MRNIPLPAPLSVQAPYRPSSPIRRPEAPASEARNTAPRDGRRDQHNGLSQGGADTRPTCSESAPRRSALPPRRGHSHPEVGSWRPKDAYTVRVSVYSANTFPKASRTPDFRPYCESFLCACASRPRDRDVRDGVCGGSVTTSLYVFFSAENSSNLSVRFSSFLLLLFLLLRLSPLLFLKLYLGFEAISLA